MSEGNRTALSKWRSPFPFVYCVVIFVVYLDQTHFCHASTTSHSAKFNITYRDLKTNTYKTDIREMGSYGVNGDKSTRAGQLVHVRTKENKTDGCTDIVNYLQTSWIALVQRGTCEIGDKIDICAKRFNASAVILYNNEKDDVLISGDKDVVSVFISKRQGLELARLVDYDPDRKVFVEIQKGQLIPTGLDTGNVNPANISKTSVLFVSISFIVLMIISLAWLVFYYIQRFRYAHAKERLTRRLASAAKKAIAKIPQRTIKSGDKELESEFDQCAVCIEGYKASDVIRILPCKHIFHKSCVDPWLLDMRSCPMCKLDILREYGMQVHLNSSQETVHAEAESGATGSGIADDAEQLSSPDEHGSQEGMDIVLIRHPSLQYHGSDTFCSTDVIQEHQVLNPQPIECNTDIITEVDIDSESECTELNSLMTGLPRKGSLHDNHSKA